MVEFVKLGEVAEIRAGFGFPIKEQGKKIGDYPFYKVADMNHIENSIYMNISDNYITCDTAKKLKCNPAPKNTIIFPKVGMTIKTNKKRLLSQISCYDNNIFGLIADEKYILSKFLYYLFDQLDLIKFAFGETAVPSIRKSAIENFEIPIPPLELQEEIVNCLDVFTNLISNLEKIITLRKKQYAYYLDEFIKIETSDIVKLKDVAIYRKERLKREFLTEDNYISVENLLKDRAGKIKSSNLPSVDSVIKYEKEDILIGNIRPYLKKIWFSDCIGGTNGDVLAIAVINKEKICPKYLYYILSSDTFFSYDVQYSQGGKMPRGRKDMILDFEFPLPTLDTQKEIVHYLDQFTTLISLLEKKLELTKKQYAYYRDELLRFERK